MALRKKMLGLLQYLLFLALGLFLLWLTLRKSNWEEIKQDILGAKFIFLIPATLMLLLSHFIRAIRWKIIMEPLGYKPSSLNTFLAVVIGYWANLAVPRLGEVLKCTALARYEKIPADKLIGTIVAERAFDVVSLLLVLAITIGLQSDLLGGYFMHLFHSGTGGISVFKIIRLVVILVFAMVLLVFLFRSLHQKPFIQRITKVINGIWQGLISVKKIRNKGWFFFHTALIWVLYLLSTYMGFYAMEGMSSYGLSVAFSVLVFGSIGMIFPAPGGMGPYQFAVQQVLMLYGVSPEKGLSLGMLIWFAQTAILIIFGTLSFFLLPALNKNKA